MWALWRPGIGFLTELSTLRGRAVQQAELLQAKKWSDLKADGWQVVKIVITPFNWDVMEVAEKAQGARHA
jgi:hypothetical protein